MSGDSLEIEMLRAAVGMPFAGVRRLLDMGMDPAALGRLCGAGLLGLARVDLQRGGLFAFDPAGEARLILGVEEGGALVDLVAIASAERDAWALRCGYAAVLGADALEAADALVMCERPAVVRLHGTPLDWLIGLSADSEALAVCVLDWNAMALRQLRGLGAQVTLACDDAAAAERLRGVLAHGGLPKVVAGGTVGEKLRRAA